VPTTKIRRGKLINSLISHDKKTNNNKNPTFHAHHELTFLQYYYSTSFRKNTFLYLFAVFALEPLMHVAKQQPLVFPQNTRAHRQAFPRHNKKT
jgi:hypothetical protein